jgi:hypothetical protein
MIRTHIFPKEKEKYENLGVDGKTNFISGYFNGL